jgi:hypothetical protein
MSSSTQISTALICMSSSTQISTALFYHIKIENARIKIKEKKTKTIHVQTSDNEDKPKK